MKVWKFATTFYREVSWVYLKNSDFLLNLTKKSDSKTATYVTQWSSGSGLVQTLPIQSFCKPSLTSLVLSWVTFLGLAFYIFWELSPQNIHGYKGSQTSSLLCTPLPIVYLCHSHFLFMSVDSINHNCIVVILNLCYSFCDPTRTLTLKLLLLIS